MKITKFYLLILLFFITGCSQDTAIPSATAEVYAMDTVMNLTAYGDNAQVAIDQAEADLLALEAQISRTREGSEIYLLNQTGTSTLSDTAVELLRRSINYGALTGGAFSCTIAPVMDVWGFTTDTMAVPSEAVLSQAMALVDDTGVVIDGNAVTLGAGQAIDLGGIGKGYAAQLVADIFTAQNISNAMVSLGGNVYVLGGRTDGDPWRIGVQDPNNLSGYAGVLSMYTGFAVTSGGYQRFFEENGVTYHHIIDPSTGYSANAGLLSVTIVSPDDGTLCDALSTALYVMGEEAAIAFWRSGVVPFEMILLTEDGRAVVSSGLHDTFIAEEGYIYDPIS
ncbi:FAD:protein FMN transferase [Bengtsoniella intestinalis]|uniref:FAD:protein FMN transferase n=1 Tax=Bengtsoniella intestinalis TaxID=3073143 RepID=UPI00391F15F8